MIRIMKATHGLIFLEIAAYSTLSLANYPIFSYLGFSPIAFERGQVWTLLTSLFVHINIIHLALNMVLLYIFGSALEEELGAVKTMTVFFVGGAGSLILGIPLSQFTTTVGSSSAVAAVAGGALLIKPDKTLPSVLFRAPVGLFATTYLVLNIVLAFYDQSGFIAYPSHVIGFGVGLILAISLKRRNHILRPI